MPSVFRRTFVVSCRALGGRGVASCVVGSCRHGDKWRRAQSSVVRSRAVTVQLQLFTPRLASQRRLPFTAMAAAQSPPLIANQRAVHQGQPGGLGQPIVSHDGRRTRDGSSVLPAQQPEKMRSPLTLAPDKVLTMPWCCTPTISGIFARHNTRGIIIPYLCGADLSENKPRSSACK